jgi:hypothetical protein
VKDALRREEVLKGAGHELASPVRDDTLELDTELPLDLGDVLLEDLRSCCLGLEHEGADAMRVVVTAGEEVAMALGGGHGCWTPEVHVDGVEVGRRSLVCGT